MKNPAQDILWCIYKPRFILIGLLVIYFTSFLKENNVNAKVVDQYKFNVKKRALNSFKSLASHDDHFQHHHPLFSTLTEKNMYKNENEFTNSSTEEEIFPNFSHSKFQKTFSNEGAIVGPFFGNAEMVTEEKIPKKRTCGISTAAARTLLGSSVKRSYFARTLEEVRQKEEDEEKSKIESLNNVKRNDFLSEGPLPWTCETKYEWKDMGQDHYPRFLRTAECKARLCFNGFFRCKPRRYKTKVLRRLSQSETASCEDEDVSLPESLRSAWKFITVTINLCCDCTGRMPIQEATS